MSKNLSFFKILILCLSVLSVGCQSFQKSNQERPTESEKIETINSAPSVSNSTQVPIPPEEDVRKPEPPLKKLKVGVLFGPAGLRLYSHIGVLQELVRQKIPIGAVAGVETGAVVAALYAHKNQPFDVEWQLMKLTESDWIDKSFLKDQPRPISSKKLNATLDLLFANMKSSETKTSFACPSYNWQKAKTYMMSRGELKQLLPYCLGLDPLFPEWQSTFAQVVDYQPVLDWFRSQGIQKVIYVNVVPKESIDNKFQVWQLVSMITERHLRDFDFVISVIPESKTVTDFEERRNNLDIAKLQSENQIKKIVNALGL